MLILVVCDWMPLIRIYFFFKQIIKLGYRYIETLVADLTVIESFHNYKKGKLHEK